MRSKLSQLCDDLRLKCVYLAFCAQANATIVRSKRLSLAGMRIHLLEEVYVMNLQEKKETNKLF